MELSFGLNHLVVRDSDFSLVTFKNCCTRVDAPVVSTFVAKIAAENRKTKLSPGEKVVMAKNKTKILSILTVALFLLSAVSLRSYAQTVKSQIQRMTGWQNCVACAGANASGPGASIYTATANSPSLSGGSRVFSIASSNPYADALWWKQLGAANSATNLVYDVYFYLKAPQNAQALEFDNNQANGSRRWIFGTQCNIAAGQWDVWGNAAGNWIHTGIHCAMPTAYKWHHLTWEFKRNGSYVDYIALTIDGVKHYVNRNYSSKASSVNELNVAVQLDMRGNHASYQEWVDNVSLKYW